MKFYMVLIEDAFQLVLGSSYLADASRWYTAHQMGLNNTSDDIPDYAPCVESALQNISHVEFNWKEFMPVFQVKYTLTCMFRLLMNITGCLLVDHVNLHCNNLRVVLH